MKPQRPATITIGPSFVESLLGAIYRDRHDLISMDKEEYPDLRTAAYALRIMCAMTQEQIAARLGIMTNKFALIEKRGSPVDMEDIERMQALAWEFNLFKIYVYFDRQKSLQRGKMKLHRRKVKDGA